MSPGYSEQIGILQQKHRSNPDDSRVCYALAMLRFRLEGPCDAVCSLALKALRLAPLGSMFYTRALHTYVLYATLLYHSQPKALRRCAEQALSLHNRRRDHAKQARKISAFLRCLSSAKGSGLSTPHPAQDDAWLSEELLCLALCVGPDSPMRESGVQALLGLHLLDVRTLLLLAQVDFFCGNVQAVEQLLGVRGHTLIAELMRFDQAMVKTFLAQPAHSGAQSPSLGALLSVALVRSTQSCTIPQLLFIDRELNLLPDQYRALLDKLPAPLPVHRGNVAIAEMMLMACSGASVHQLIDGYLDYLSTEEQAQPPQQLRVLDAIRKIGSNQQRARADLFDPQSTTPMKVEALPAVLSPELARVLLDRLPIRIVTTTGAVTALPPQRIFLCWLWLDNLYRVRLPLVDRMANHGPTVTVRFLFASFRDQSFPDMTYYCGCYNHFVLPEPPHYILLPQEKLLLYCGPDSNSQVLSTLAVIELLRLANVQFATRLRELQTRVQDTDLGALFRRKKGNAMEFTPLMSFLLLNYLERTATYTKLQSDYERHLERCLPLLQDAAVSRRCTAICAGATSAQVQKRFLGYIHRLDNNSREAQVYKGRLSGDQAALAQQIVQCNLESTSLGASDPYPLRLIQQISDPSTSFLLADAVQLCVTMIRKKSFQERKYLNYLRIHFEEILNWGFLDVDIIYKLFARNPESARYQLQYKQLIGQVDSELVLALTQLYLHNGRKINSTIEEYCLMIANGHLPISGEDTLDMMHAVAVLNPKNRPLQQLIEQFKVCDSI